ncbi:MAG: single-stranded-DNA-specific exonuclease RecJ [Neisseriaceae bacterium]|nr:single-stranded-DNA-specific exonuclease RecJ [Neisseriaceae bacterium]
MTKITIRPYDEQHYHTLTNAGVSPLLARLFAARGVAHEQETYHSLQYLQHFGSLKNIDAAASRLSHALKNKQHIVVIGDYDADGATATALAVSALRQMGGVVDYLLPNRFTDGYGLSPALVDMAQHKGADLLLTVDNGIAAVAAVDYAQTQGIETIVTDHHLPADTTPDCIIVNPNQAGCAFPYKSTAGVGVMFYVLLALRNLLQQQNYFSGSLKYPNLADYLDLVALGTVADVVKLEHNNRILVHQGLKRIRQGKMRLGLSALFTIAKRDYKTAKTFDLAFCIAPRLNAAGRLDDMDLGVRCLLSQNEDEALELAQELNTLNQERRSIEKGMVNEALQLPDIKENNHYTISVFGNDWHEGVIGIVAGRLKEQFYRPTIAFAPADNGLCKGSGRSIDNLHLRDALDLTAKRYPDLIVKFGGHAMAAGLTIRQSDFQRFQAAFETVVADLLNPDDLIKEYRTDGGLETHEITLDTAQTLEQHIWGQGFPPPLFCDEFSVLQQKIVGENHSKLLIEKDGKIFDAMLFRDTTRLPEKVRLVYRLSVNIWQNKQELQMVVEHWQGVSNE